MHIPLKAMLLAFVAAGCAISPPPSGDIASVVTPPASKPLRPDLTGVWGYSNGSRHEGDDTGASVTFGARDGNLANFETDFAVLERSDENMPLYKPEYWEVIRDNDFHGLAKDPTFTCQPSGVPRMGPPQRIVQDGQGMIFLYTGEADVFRLVPIDGRPISDEQLGDATWRGYASGRWEGETLVVESKAFNDQSWLGWAGWIHSMDMVVTERLWRTGDMLHWQATVDDPMFLEPWRTHEVTKKLNPDRETWFWETPPCVEHDLEHITDKDVRG